MTLALGGGLDLARGTTKPPPGWGGGHVGGCRGWGVRLLAHYRATTRAPDARYGLAAATEHTPAMWIAGCAPQPAHEYQGGGGHNATGQHVRGHARTSRLPYSVRPSDVMYHAGRGILAGRTGADCANT